MKSIDQLLHSPESTLEVLQELKRALRGVAQDIADAGLFVPAGGPLDVMESLLSIVPEKDQACAACGGTGLIVETDALRYSAPYTCARCRGYGKEPSGWVVKRCITRRIAPNFFVEGGASREIFASIEEAKEAASKALECHAGGKIEVAKDLRTGLYRFYVNRELVARTVGDTPHEKH